MDGVVIHVSADQTHALIWCSDQGPLGLVPRDDMPRAPHPPLVVGDVVSFVTTDAGPMRLCGQLALLPDRAMPTLPDLLRVESSAPRRKPAPLAVVARGA